MTWSIFSSTTSNIDPQTAIELASDYIGLSQSSNDPKKSLELCKEAKALLRRAEKSSKTNLTDLTNSIAPTYQKLGSTFDTLNEKEFARSCYSKAQELGFRDNSIQLPGSPSPPQSPRELSPIARSLRHSLTLFTAPLVPVSNPIGDVNDQTRVPSGPDADNKIIRPDIANAVDTNFTSSLPQKIFKQDVEPLVLRYPLPDPGRRLTTSSQLAYTAYLLDLPVDQRGRLDKATAEWCRTTTLDKAELERLRSMPTELVRAFIRDELKNRNAILEVVSLAAILEKNDIRGLLESFISKIQQSTLLDVNLLDGLASLIKNASPGSIEADDLVQILRALSTRLASTHKQSTRFTYSLAAAVSSVLDAMIDHDVSGLNRLQLHEPLSDYLKELYDSSDPVLLYRLKYAYQALQHISNDETKVQMMLRRSGKVVLGVAGLARAVKALDLNGFLDGLRDIQEGTSDLIDRIKFVCKSINSSIECMEKGQESFESFKEGLQAGNKRRWYLALRGIDAFLQEGRFVEFERLVREAPCRHDQPFLWGVCQRLGDVAISSSWDYSTRQNSISFLKVIYRDDLTWKKGIDVKRLVLVTLTQLHKSSDYTVSSWSRSALKELLSSTPGGSDQPVSTEPSHDSGFVFLTEYISTSQSARLMDIVQNRLDVETPILQLKRDRLLDLSEEVYIPPRAKSDMRATDDFDLMSRVQGFLSSEKKVLLLLGDSGAGKSTFNRALEIELWKVYERECGAIPLFIHLPTINKPEYELIDKHLRNISFCEEHIRDLKMNRKIILICDGYDESQQTRNLYTANQLNRPGGWQVQLLISCRTEYIGVDYRDQFQPTDVNTTKISRLFQEAVLVPFNKAQIRHYIDQFIRVTSPPWSVDEYTTALQNIPNLQDMTTNPFLLKIALEVLPTLIKEKEKFSTTRIARVELYDEFILQWIERNKKRFTGMNLMESDRRNLKILLDSGFSQHGFSYLKELSAAIYDHQGGNPIVRYSIFRDRKSWKADFLDSRDENEMLKEAIPLIRSGEVYRFIHKSVLEYGFALSIFDPQCFPSGDQQSSSSQVNEYDVLDDEFQSLVLMTGETSDTQLERILSSPLGRINIVEEWSVVRFLVDRAQRYTHFKDLLHQIIHLSKTDDSASIAAANAITILVKSGVQFHGTDLSGIRIQGADLSNGVFDSVSLKGANLQNVNFRNAWLCRANMDETIMNGVKFGEIPSIRGNVPIYEGRFSPDGKFFIALMDRSYINIYDTLTWTKFSSVRSNVFGLCSMDFSAMMNEVLLGMNTGDIQVKSITLESTVCTLMAHRGPVTSVVYSSDETCIASGSDDGTVRIWDSLSKVLVCTLDGKSGGVKSVSFSPQGNHVVSGYEGTVIIIWDIATQSAVRILYGHDDQVTSVTYSPCGGRIASGSSDMTVRIWDEGTGALIHKLEGHSGIIRSIAYSPRGDQLASGGNDNSVFIWDVSSGSHVSTLKGHIEPISSISYSPDGNIVASADIIGNIFLRDIKGGIKTSEFRGHSRSVDAVSYSPDLKQVASIGDPSSVRIWDVESGELLRTLHLPHTFFMHVAFSADGNEITTGSNNGVVHTWNAATGACIFGTHYFKAPLDSQQNHTSLSSYSYSWNFDTIVCRDSTDTILHIWNPNWGVTYRTLYIGLQSEGIRSVTASSNKIGILSQHGKGRIWDISSGLESRSVTHVGLYLHANTYGYYTDIELSPAGDSFVLPGSKNILIFDMDEGPPRKISTKCDAVKLVYSSEGDKIVCGFSDDTIKIWDNNLQLWILEIPAYGDRIKSITYRGDYLAVGNHDCTLRQWKIIRDGNKYEAQLCWMTPHNGLKLSGVSFQGAQGLSSLDETLLSQHDQPKYHH